VVEPGSQLDLHEEGLPSVYFIKKWGELASVNQQVSQDVLSVAEHRLQGYAHLN